MNHYFFISVRGLLLAFAARGSTLTNAWRVRLLGRSWAEQTMATNSMNSGKNPATAVGEKAGGIQVIARAAAILRVLGGHPQGLSLGAIAQQCGLPRST